MSKSKQKKQRDRKRAALGRTERTMSRALYEGLMEADKLGRGGKWDRARDLLEDLDRRHPNRPEVLTALINVYYELHDLRGYMSACRRLRPLKPNDPDLVVGLAGSYLANFRSGLALQTFRQLLDRWPDDVRAEDIRKTMAQLAVVLDEAMDAFGLPGENRVELAIGHDEIRCLLDEGRYDQVCEVAEKLLRQHPDFLPAYNNMGEAHFQRGRLDEAVATARRVLQRAPENFHALANLTRYLCLGGQLDEARTWAEKLKLVQADDCDIWIKKAEALSFLGDDQGIVEVLDQAERSEDGKDLPALLYHLAAVAAMRLGQEAVARGHWRKSLKLNPHLDVARENLDDLKRPAAERHAPWAYPLNHWISEGLFRKFSARLFRAERRGKERAVAREARQCLEEFPQVAKILPVLLDRGDAAGREFAQRLILLAQSPELMAVLGDFALSQRGPDKMRQEAAQAAREAGLLPAGPIRMWLQGEWHEILLMGFEISGEPRKLHSPAVEKWANQGALAMGEGDGERAEELFKRGLEIEPGSVMLRYNLAGAYRLQGRTEESDRLVREVFQQEPDYFFGRVTMARMYLDEDEIDKAKEMLRPLMERRQLHFSEFAALCEAQIEVCMAEGQTEGARTWLGMWEKIVPEHPGLERWRGELSRGGWGRLFGRR